MINLGVSPGTSAEVRDAMLRVGSWQIGPELPPGSPHDFDVVARFASGDLADNKIIADLLLLPYAEYAAEVPGGPRVSPDELKAIKEVVLSAYDSLLLGSHDVPPDAVWGVPSGGQSYAKARADRLGLPFIELAKVDVAPGRKTFRPATNNDVKLLRSAQRLIGSEDAGSAGTSPYGAMYESDEYGLAELRDKTVGIDYVWVRGVLEKLRGSGLLIRTIVNEQIPNRIERTNGFYQRFGHLAVPSPALA